MTTHSTSGHLRARRRIVRTAALAGLVLAGAVGLAPSADAAPYDGSNPVSTGCASNATTIASRPIKSPQATFGTMEVRYSPSCQTNWIRAVLNTNYANTVAVKWIERPAQGNLSTAGSVDSDAAQTSFGMQLYAPGSTCITVSVDLTSNSQVIATTGRVQLC